MSKLTTFLFNERNKFKQLKWSQKLLYLWDYYRNLLLLMLLALLVVFYITNLLQQRSKEIVLQGFFSNDDYELFDAKAIEKDFVQYLNLDSNERVVFDDSLYVELDSSSEYIVASQGKISAYIAAKELDFLVTTAELAKHYSSHIPLVDFEHSLPENILSKLASHLQYIEGVDQIKKAYAIDLSKSRFLKNLNHEVQTSYYLVIPSNIIISDEILAFLTYAFEW